MGIIMTAYDQPCCEPLTANILNKGNLLRKPHVLSFPLRIFVYVLIVLLMSNINAFIDAIFHPEIPYVDEEHVIVGFASSIITALLCLSLEIYLRYLEKAINKIRLLESFLSICSYCKKIKIPNSDPENTKSWKTIEFYIAEKTQTRFSHGICPSCLAEHFPEEMSDEQLEE